MGQNGTRAAWAAWAAQAPTGGASSAGGAQPLRHSAPVTLQPLQSDASGPPAESKAPAHAPLPLYTSSRLSHRPLATDPAPSLQGSGLRQPAFQTRRNGSRNKKQRLRVPAVKGGGVALGGVHAVAHLQVGWSWRFQWRRARFPWLTAKDEGQIDRQRARETR